MPMTVLRIYPEELLAVHTGTWLFLKLRKEKQEEVMLTTQESGELEVKEKWPLTLYSLFNAMACYMAPKLLKLNYFCQFWCHQSLYIGR